MNEAAEPAEGRTTERVRAIVEEVIAETPMYVVEVVVRGRRGSQAVDVFVESDEVLDVEALARVSREVGFLLDAEEVIAGRYNLNVSSPGLDRPLLQPRQFRKNVGRTLAVRFRAEDESEEQRLEGELVEADEDGVTFRLSDGATRRLPLETIADARVKLPW